MKMEITQDSLLKMLAEVEAIETKVDDIKNQISSLNDKKNLLQLMIEEKYSRLKTAMEESKQKEVKFDHIEAKIPKARTVVSVENEELIPNKYKNEKPATLVVDKARLKKALEAGEKIKGASLVDGEVSVKLKEI